MPDRFIDRVASLANDTNRALRGVSEVLRSVGLPSDAAVLSRVAEQHAIIARDCLDQTQPIDFDRRDVDRRLRDHAAQIQELSGRMLAENLPDYLPLARIVGQLLAIADRYE